jgi:hypothetical protein
MKQTNSDWQMMPPPPSTVLIPKCQYYLTCPKQHRFVTDRVPAYGQPDQFLNHKD